MKKSTMARRLSLSEQDCRETAAELKGAQAEREALASDNDKLRRANAALRREVAGSRGASRKSAGTVTFEVVADTAKAVAAVAELERRAARVWDGLAHRSAYCRCSVAPVTSSVARPHMWGSITGSDGEVLRAGLMDRVTSVLEYPDGVWGVSFYVNTRHTVSFTDGSRFDFDSDSGYTLTMHEERR